MHDYILYSIHVYMCIHTIIYYIILYKEICVCVCACTYHYAIKA